MNDNQKKRQKYYIFRVYVQWSGPIALLCRKLGVRPGDKLNLKACMIAGKPARKAAAAATHTSRSGKRSLLLVLKNMLPLKEGSRYEVA